ncbi:hypothetical protein Tco_0774636 [Tanacetum coccineum]|uniref:Uncharacterized protein n=1 Tax=Tanacetum coccineum TaxID=301880 RepID=A0ABQ4ZPX9_9ASTR
MLIFKVQRHTLDIKSSRNQESLEHAKTKTFLNSQKTIGISKEIVYFQDDAKYEHVSPKFMMRPKTKDFFKVINHGVTIERYEQQCLWLRSFLITGRGEEEVMKNKENPLGYCDIEVTKIVREWKEVFEFMAGVPMVMPTEGDQTVEYANQFLEACSRRSGGSSDVMTGKGGVGV